MFLPPRHTDPLRNRSVHIILLLFILSSVPLAAQRVTSRGDDFWVTFIPNHGSEGDKELLTPYLYLTADRTTAVTITSIESGASHTVTIGYPGLTAEVDLSDIFGDKIELDDAPGAAAISARSFHIESTADIALMAMSLKFRSADAFLILPAELLGTRYYALGYRNGRGYGTGPNGYDMPSEFAVVATEDNTVIQINPPANTPIRGYGNGPFSIVLDRGEVFLVQAEIRAALDLSGTEVVASAPVALFAGCKRTSIPSPVGNYRDHLVEQIPPVSTWGRDFLITPTFEPSWLSRDTSRLRVLAGPHGAMVTVEGSWGTSEFLLQPGTFFEIPVAEPMAIRSTLPVLTAFYQHSVNAETQMSDTVTALRGDPFMMLSQPVEWFDSTYHVVIPRSDPFSLHYINVIVPEEMRYFLRIDGVPVDAEYHTIPWSRYRYAQIEIMPGAHTITAPAPFGLSVYGYGDMISYGYIGGMRATHTVVSGIPHAAPPDAMSLALAGSSSDGGSCSLDLMLAHPEQLDLDLVDLRGSVVRKLLDGEKLDAGGHRITVDLSSLPSGLYLCRAVTAAGASVDTKLVVAR